MNASGGSGEANSGLRCAPKLARERAEGIEGPAPARTACRSPGPAPPARPRARPVPGRAGSERALSLPLPSACGEAGGARAPRAARARVRHQVRLRPSRRPPLPPPPPPPSRALASPAAAGGAGAGQVAAAVAGMPQVYIGREATRPGSAMWSASLRAMGRSWRWI